MARAVPRGFVRRKPECKTTSRRTDDGMDAGGRAMQEQLPELDTRLSRRAELAHDSEGHEFARYSKSGGGVVTDICSCNICIPAIHGGHSSCSYLGRSETCAVQSEPRVLQQCRACRFRSQQRSYDCMDAGGRATQEQLPSSGECWSAFKAKDQRSRTRQRLAVLVPRAACAKREVWNGV